MTFHTRKSSFPSLVVLLSLFSFCSSSLSMDGTIFDGSKTSSLQHVLYEIHKKHLELQRDYVTAVDLYRIVTSIKDRPEEQINS